MFVNCGKKIYNFLFFVKFSCNDRSVNKKSMRILTLKIAIRFIKLMLFYFLSIYRRSILRLIENTKPHFLSYFSEIIH